MFLAREQDDLQEVEEVRIALTKEALASWAL